jgi:hypothetical protein
MGKESNHLISSIMDGIVHGSDTAAFITSEYSAVDSTADCPGSRGKFGDPNPTRPKAEILWGPNNSLNVAVICAETKETYVISFNLLS